MTRLLKTEIGVSESREQFCKDVQLHCAVFLHSAVPQGGYVSQVSTPTVSPVFKDESQGVIYFLLTFAATATVPVYDDQSVLPDALQDVVEHAAESGMGTRISG
jgi:hypothetical protein